MKTEFELEWAGKEATKYKISIVGQNPDHPPYVSITPFHESEPLFIPDKQLERFAVNILKALKSKKLNTKK